MDAELVTVACRCGTTIRVRGSVAHREGLCDLCWRAEIRELDRISALLDRLQAKVMIRAIRLDDHTERRPTMDISVEELQAMFSRHSEHFARWSLCPEVNGYPRSLDVTITNPWDPSLATLVLTESTGRSETRRLELPLEALWTFWPTLQRVLGKMEQAADILRAAQEHAGRVAAAPPAA